MRIHMHLIYFFYIVNLLGHEDLTLFCKDAHFLSLML